MGEATSRPTAFVTGASRGIGAAIALGLARDGFDLAVSATRTAHLAPTLAALAAAGGRAVPIALDLASLPSTEKAMAEAIAALDHLDVLVNNAGITLLKAAVDLTPEDWDAILRTNVTGTFFLSQAMARHLIGARRPGSIINVASTHGLVGLPRRAAYGVSKGAIIQMTRMLAIEWAEHGIRVNAVAPGTVETASRAAMYAAEPGLREAMLDRVPLHRFGTADEVAGAVRYLAGPQATYITGQVFCLDGGLTAR